MHQKLKLLPLICISDNKISPSEAKENNSLQGKSYSEPNNRNNNPKKTAPAEPIKSTSFNELSFYGALKVTADNIFQYTVLQQLDAP